MSVTQLTYPAPFFVCARCGIRVPTGCTHACIGGGVIGTGFPMTNVPQIDPSHWLYKAGYEQGYQDAMKTRDLSPAGKHG